MDTLNNQNKRGKGGETGDIFIATGKIQGNENFDSPYHPFKSEQAKEEYLRVYDKRAKNGQLYPKQKW